MHDSAHSTDPPSDPNAGDAGLWPSADYHRQIERLRAAVGETVYLDSEVERDADTDVSDSSLVALTRTVVLGASDPTDAGRRLRP
ncbi:MAG: hypothetical protein MZV65_50885 [Chromatiales bacterium]|nr:hypothetical protein [Chromatiales bacterium]